MELTFGCYTYNFVIKEENPTL